MNKYFLQATCPDGVEGSAMENLRDVLVGSLIFSNYYFRHFQHGQKALKGFKSKLTKIFERRFLSEKHKDAFNGIASYNGNSFFLTDFKALRS